MNANSLFANKREEILTISRKMIAAQAASAVTQSLNEGRCKLMHRDTMAVCLEASVSNTDLSAWSIAKAIHDSLFRIRQSHNQPFVVSKSRKAHFRSKKN